ncbi:Katanin p80 subunit, partial [Globisporangium splendens]
MLRLQSLSGHQSAVESLVFDPSERKVIAGSKAGSIKAFDLEAGKVSRTFKGHMSTCTTLDYHLYGDYVASGSLDTIVKVWDLRTKSCMQTFKGHKTEVTNVCFTPDGRWLTSGGLDGAIRIWDLTAGKLLREFSDHGGAITNLEFNPEEFILVSASADKTLRFWDVQEFALIGLTPTDNATTTTMCHTVAEPHSGKYLFCCSQEAVRVWSYETAIEYHDSVMCPRPKEIGAVETHADSTMLQDMKVMIGSIQDAFVSIWVLDANQLRPFNNGARMKAEPPRASAPVPAVAAPVPTSSNQLQITPTPSTNSLGQPLARNSSNMSTERLAPDFQNRVAVSSRPTTPAVAFPSPSNASAAAVTANPVQFVEDPRRSLMSSLPTHLAWHCCCFGFGTEQKIDFRLQKILLITWMSDRALTILQEEVVTADYIMELRCGMDTCVKTFKARQKAIQQLLVYWEKGSLHDGFRYLSQLPNGKREALVVDVLQITDFQALGLDLEGCALLLPLVTELLVSKFEMYLGVGIEYGQKLFDAFSPIVKDSIQAKQFRSREVNLAGEER